MTALNRTLPLSKTHHVAVLIRQHLKLDVPRMFDILFHVQIAIAECTRRLRLRCPEQSGKFFLAAHNAHAATTAACRRLHDHRETHLPCPFHGFPFRSENTFRSRQNRYACALHRRASFFFFPHQPRHFRPRSNKLNSAGFANLGKVRILCQQSIAGMHRVHVRNLRRADHRRNVQVTQRQLWRPNADGFIRKAHGQGVPVGLAVNRNRANAELLACANYAQRNFSAIRNENFLEHESAFSSQPLAVSFQARLATFW